MEISSGFLFGLISFFLLCWKKSKNVYGKKMLILVVDF